MDFKQLVTHFAYKIEPKPEGGFIARASDPSVPPLEAPTRAELQQKIQQNILKALSNEFPGLKLPAEGKHLELSFHVERKPGGGFSIHSADATAPVIETSDQKEFESTFMEKFMGFAGKHLMPELSQAVAAQVGSADVKFVVNGKTSFRVNSGPEGLTFGAPKTLAASAGLTQGFAQSSASDSKIATIAGTLDSKPIVPESSNFGKVFATILLVLILGGLTCFVLYYR